MAELIAIDIEAKSTGEVIGIGVYKPGKYRFFRPNELPPNLGDYVQVYHGGSYDMQFGYKGLRHDHDTLIMSSLLPFEHHGLEKLAVQVLGVEPWKGMVKRKKLEVETFNTVMNYNELDCRYTYQLFFKLQSMLKMKGNWEYYLKYSMPLRRELDLLEQEGIRLNQDKLEGIRRMYAQKVQEAEGEIKDKYQKEIKEIEADLLTKAMSKVKTDKAKEDRRLHPEDYNAVFNLQSNDHVLTLFNLCGLSPKKFDRKSLTIKDSTSTEALSKMKGVLPKTFLNWRKAVKMLQFLTKWDELSKDNKIHPRYNQHTVVTGRLSSSDPNIQQVPVRDNPEIRDIFIPDEGKVYVIADYSQIELRLAGYFSQDGRLIKLIESGGDFHGYVAKDVFNLSCDPADVKKLYPTERSIAKTIVYLTLYGGSADALLEQLGTQGIDKTLQECKTFLKAFANAYPKLKAYGFTVGAMADRQGYVQTLFGRKVWIPKGEGRHKGLNYQLQGSASELNAFSIIASGPEIRQLGGRVVALIHDEIIVECPVDRAGDVGGILRQHMLDKVNLNVPLDIDIHIGNTWGAKGE